MRPDLTQMIRDALDLPEAERAALAGLLIESLEPPPESDVEAARMDEVERRWGEIELGTAQGIPWEEVRAKLLLVD